MSLSTTPTGMKRAPLASDITSKLQQANIHREEGNAHFKSGMFKRAISCYGKALAYTRGLPGSNRGLDGIAAMSTQTVSHEHKVSKEDENKAIEIEVAVQSNIAVCYINLGKADAGLEYANKAIASNANYWKAYLRKGECQVMLNQLDEAEATFKAAQKLCVEDAGLSKISTLMHRLKQLQKIEFQKQKKAFNGIFEKAQRSNDDN